MNRFASHSSSTSRWWLGVLAVIALASALVGAMAWLRQAQLQTALRLREEDVARLEVAASKNERKLLQLQVLQDDLERYRKQAEEVPRLRGQYQEWQRLKREHTALQAEFDRLRAGLGAPSALATPPAPSSRGSWIGIALGPSPSGSGVAVLVVAPGGPAANAGVQAADLILAVDGRPVTTFQQVKDLIRDKPAGQPILLDLSRDGVRTLISVAAAPMPSFD